MEYNGGSVIAMVGKDCVAIASDLRLGNQALGVSSNFQKVCDLLCTHNHLSFPLDLPSDRQNLPWTTRIGYGCYHFVRPVLPRYSIPISEPIS